MSAVEQLNTQIKSAQAELSAAQEHATAANVSYKQAIATGDDKAAESFQDIAEDGLRVTRRINDRLQFLRDQLPDAELTDNKPAYEAAVKELEAAMAAEWKIYDKAGEVLLSIISIQKQLQEGTDAASTALHKVAAFKGFPNPCPNPAPLRPAFEPHVYLMLAEYAASACDYRKQHSEPRRVNFKEHAERSAA